MGAKRVQFVIQGMNRDLSESKFSSKYSYENKNIRLIATDDNDTLSVVNEKGTLPATIIWDQLSSDESSEFVTGYPIGQVIIDNNIVLFTATYNGFGCIYKLWFDDDDQLNGSRLFNGNLNFNLDYPIEALGIYESTNLRKVFWVDGVNQPRIINISASQEERSTWTAKSFDFVPEIELNEEITIYRDIIAGGVFAPGTIQYMFSYYNLYGQESNIFYTSPLYYTSYNDRGAAPDKTVSNSFTINIVNYDTSFDYIRVYAILRTTADGIPQARRVVDLEINQNGDPINYVDTGVNGDAIDPTELLYIGGEDIIAGTIAEKDNTLFLGDIKINRPLVSDTIKDSVRNLQCEFSNNAKAIYNKHSTDTYSYDNQLGKNSEEIKTFKYLEWYRLGIQAQYKNGKWSEPIYIGDFQNPKKNYVDTSNNIIKLVNISSTVGVAITNGLLDEGYVRIRPVIVYPELSDRECICQGVLNPTVYNVEDRWTNSPFVQSSWIFRPNAPIEVLSSEMTSQDQLTYLVGGGAEFRHSKPIPSNKALNAEIQCISWPSDNPYVKASGVTNMGPWVAHCKEDFFIDQSIFTMNSPEIEFGNDLVSMNTTDLKFRIIGCIPINYMVGDINIETDTPPQNFQKGANEFEKNTPTGFYKENVKATANYAWRALLSNTFWMDAIGDLKDYDFWKAQHGFVVYLWNKTGALNNTQAPDQSGYLASKLKRKVISNLRYSAATYYLDANQIWYAYEEASLVKTGISKIAIFDSDEKTMLRLDSPENSKLDRLNYYGNIDKAIGVSMSKYTEASPAVVNPDKTKGYPIAIQTSTTGIIADISHLDEYNSNAHIYRLTKIAETYGKNGRAWAGDNPLFVNNTDSLHGISPVLMKYKSTPHAVIALNYSAPNDAYPRAQRILPTINNKNVMGGAHTGKYGFWDNNYTTSYVYQDSISISDYTVRPYGYLWLGELYNDNVPNRFGGTTPEAIANNKWEPCGEPVKLVRGYAAIVDWNEGDTYFQRYDCLKTYPYTSEDLNSVVDILSFMCETRINIDGRYDNNRGQTSNLYMSPKNFNLLNKAYTQSNNFFTYRILNQRLLNETDFANIVTWGKTKTLGETIDSWANAVLANSLDFNGALGKVNALRKFNDNIIVFQDKGISQLLYNEQYQITTTTGTPIEIANSGKVNGKRYIVTNVGCTNKWSICETPLGIYFVDSLNKDIYLFDGKLNNLTDKFGFHSWVVNNFKDNAIWSPVKFDGCVTNYDPINGDIFFTLKNTCLAFSEGLGNFSSFYDYNETPYLSTINSRSIWWRPKYDAGIQRSYPYFHREGAYNNFFNVKKPYWVTIITNPNEANDKIFNNIEFRADAFVDDDDNYNTYNKDLTFDTLTAWNEYQKGIADLTFGEGVTPLKKKFRIWRAKIPRNNTNEFGDLTTSYSRDRLRNPWLYVKLGMEKQNNYQQDDKVVLHDLIIDYFE